MQDNQTSENRPDAGATRATIMDTARAVAEREGVENLTLGKVATQTGLQRSLVYRLFARKEDLLMSIVAEDLAALARRMHGIDWPQGGDTPETAVILSLPRAPDAPAAETPAEMVDIAKDVSVALAAAPATEAVVPRQRLARRADLAQVLGGDEPEATPRTPDAWLERRLRVFERAMTAMEARQEQVEKNSRAAVSTAEENIKALEAAIEELKTRADAGDARHKSSSNEVRAALNETALRIQTVEGVARAALAENSVAVAPVAEVAPVAPEAEAPAASPAEPSPADTAPKSFIAGVRQSVVAASAAAAANAQTEVKASEGRKGITRYLLGGLVVLVIFIAAAGMAFSKGVDDGRRDALTHVTPMSHRTAARETSLDRLTARARAGDTAAELGIALRYLSGSPKDMAAAMHWATLAAVHGQPVAQYVLGTLYTQSAPAKALQWFEAAALQGNRKAMHALAIAYAEGQGTAKSSPEAVRWFSRAAGLGYVDAQFNLAVLYERGTGVPQSLLDAYKWYAVAGRQGDAEAKLRIEALRTQLNADDMAAAQHAADAFQAAPYDVAANTVP